MADPTSSFDFDGARQAGFTDDQIVQHLASDPEKLAGGYDVSGALKAGFKPSHIIQHLGGKLPEDSYGESFTRGVGDMVGGLGKTIETHLGKNVASDYLQNAGSSLTPQDTRPAQIVDQSGVHGANVPSAMLENSPRLAAALLAAKAIPGPWWAKGLGAAATGFLTSAGNEAQEAADKRTGQPNSPVTGTDLTRGDLTSAASNAVSMAPSALLLKGAGPAAGALGSLKKLGIALGAEGAGGAAGQVTHDVMQGDKIDPTQVANAAATNVATAAPIGARNVARDVLDNAKYGEFKTPEMKQAATQFANRAQEIADGRNLQGGLVYPAGVQRTGAEVYTKASAAVRSELSGAVEDLRKTTELPADANHALNAAVEGGQHITPREFDLIANAVKGTPQADNVMNLVRQARVADVVRDKGTISNGKFKGGFSRVIPAALDPHNVYKTGLATFGGVLAEETGHFMHYAAPVVGLAAGGHILGKLADNVTGAQTPMGRFVRNFADGQTPVRLPVNQPPEPAPEPVNQPPQAPLAGPPRPWSSPLAAAALLQQKRADAAMPALQQLARANMPPPMSLQSPAVRAAPPKPAPAIDPLNLPRSITTPASNIISGISAANKMRAAYEGQQAAQREITASPFLEQKVGGAENVPTPAAAKDMRQAIGAANALAKLRSDPEAEAAAKAAVKKPETVAKVAKSNGKTETHVGGGENEEYVVPRSAYAHLSPEAAAHQSYEDHKDAVKYKTGYVNAAQRKITDIRSRAAAVQQEVPSVNAKEIAAQFEGIESRKAAERHREWLKLKMPGAAGAIDRAFPNEALEGLWNRVGK